MFFLHLCLCITESQKQTLDSTGFTDGCKPPYGCWESNTGPQRRRQSHLSSSSALVFIISSTNFGFRLLCKPKIQPTSVYSSASSQDCRFQTSSLGSGNRPASTDLNSRPSLTGGSPTTCPALGQLQAPEDSITVDFTHLTSGIMTTFRRLRKSLVELIG